MKNKATKTQKLPSNKSPKKPLLASVKGSYRVSHDILLKHGLEKLLTIEARSWTDTERLVDAYFMNAKSWSKNGEKTLSELINGLRIQ
jgi:hypothetical protein